MCILASVCISLFLYLLNLCIRVHLSIYTSTTVLASYSNYIFYLLPIYFCNPSIQKDQNNASKRLGIQYILSPKTTSFQGTHKSEQSGVWLVLPKRDAITW